MVEFALTLPIFLLLIFAVFDLGRAVYAYNTITNAAREGARFGIVQPSPLSVSAVQSHVQAYAGPLGLTAANITVSCSPVPTCNPVQSLDTLTVAVTYQYVPVVGYIISIVGNNVTLQTASTMVMQ